MKFAYTNERMRVLDAQTIEAGTSSLMLMERAGKELADRVCAVMRKKGIGDVLFVCGGGNNGGDGFVAARYVREGGYDADVICLAQKFSSDCAVQKEKFGACMGRIPRRRYALIVDCLFGTGLTRAIEGDGANLVSFINQSGAYVIACDVPSGLAEGGVTLDPCVRADETLTIGQLKEALLLADGADMAGSRAIGVRKSGKGTTSNNFSRNGNRIRTRGITARRQFLRETRSAAPRFYLRARV